ncbi:MAG: T9SS type A sorting domain-containing protein [candidate division KSB1 bacterium]|nr:T9SS type A sorting domain-containing protein [candidate division KSB1 bacterium]MDZ7302540.1 T9SS type A sorting domain-containing protein [candidate division KSB1 bacterium]MDZ7310694.1 T9SS type A sorting domain-containing protein [candidate division KSB1 bacterium]
MKKLACTFMVFVTAFLMIGVVTTRAQVLRPVKTWDFESSLENWVAGNEKSSIELTTEKAASGTQSVKLVKPATGLESNLQNDVYKDFKEGDVISVKVWISAADLALVNGFQIFWQTGSGWSWNNFWIGGSSLTGDAWNTIERTFPAVATPIQRLGFQLLLKTGNESATPAWYVDDITISRKAGPALVDQWGKTNRGTAWPILNTSTTPAGDAGIGSGAPPTAWATIRGGFDQTYQATTDQAVVVSGQLELVGGGGGSAYTHLRYALTYQDSIALNYQYTDSARWITTGTTEKGHYGYEFTPRTGTGTLANGTLGVGTVWTVPGVLGWNSTYSGNAPLITVYQAPRNAEMVAGIYNWAISVRPLGDGSNEIRWYLVEKDNKYWFGGIAIDTAEVSTKFNGICFGFNNDTKATRVNLYAVKVDLGKPIDIPEAPWQAFYVNQWGKTNRGTAWPILNDATYLDGDASIGSGAPPTAWATIRGGFGDAVQATKDKAIIVSGQLELVGGGGGSAYTHLRYALTYQDSIALNYQYTDSARWITTGTTEKGHYGYEFTPRTGTGTLANGTLGVGTVWTVPGVLGWNSTYSGNAPLITVYQAPRNAEMVAGLYNWAISVRPLGDGSNEIRWYLVEKDNKYWFGGIAIDTAEVSTKFNGICFGFNNDTKATRVNLYAVKVDLGKPIDIPEAPWQAFYVNQWGKTNRGTAWPILNDATYLDGDASIGSGAPPTAWATIRGGFGDAVQATKDKAIIVSGQLELVGGGGGSAYTHLRYALTYQDSIALNYQYTDSARWMTTGKTEKGHYGYEFTPRTGTGTLANGTLGVGTVWTVPGVLGWNSTYQGNAPLITVYQAPRNAEMVAGLYNWAISVRPLGDGSNEIRWYLVEKDNKYWFGGIAIDTAEVSTKFNGICFGFNNDTKATRVNLYAVKVDLGKPIDIPEAPWQAFYVNQWGKTNRGTAWPILNDATYLDGDASIGSGAPPTAWATIRGGFGDAVQATKDKAIIVSGQLELVGGGGGSAYTHLRYALTYQDSIALNYQYTDSAKWMTTGKTEKGHYGYEFTPRTGTGTLANGPLGVGTVWTVPGVLGWNSTYQGNAPLITVNQAPRNAEMVAGLYNWAISVRPLGDGSNEIRWYLVEKDKKYWFGGIAIDTAEVSTKFNGICFGFNNDTKATRVNLYAVKVDLGKPIDIPEAPWEAYYVETWGFIGGRIGGWKFTPGDFAGNVTISGNAPPTSWSAIRGGFFEPIKPTGDKALVITGQMEFVGGGFEAWSSLRFGVFYSDSAGTVITTPVDSTRWSGTENHHYGYLFLPMSGDAGPVNWQGIGKTGTFGAIVDRPWLSTNGPNDYVLGSNLPKPDKAVGSAGVYDFAISVLSKGPGVNEVRFKLIKKDNSYAFAGIAVDNHVPLVTDKFNCIAFALNTNASTTAMKLTDVKIDLGAPIELPPWVISVEAPKVDIVPTEYALTQNYPNPFNPTTTIEFALPRKSEVSLVVYDLSGRVVAELARGNFNAGFYKVDFDAANLVSGIYCYKLKAGNFVSVKKLMLLK